MKVNLPILANIMIFLVIITMIIQLYKSILKNKLRKIEIDNDMSIKNVCNSMIQLYNQPNIKIEQSINGIDHYDPVKNKITLKKINQLKIYDLIVATHEVGHYIDRKENSFPIIIAIKFTFLTAFNRLVLIPFFITYFYLKIIWSTKALPILPIPLFYFLIILFYITSLIRIVTCIPIERNASKIANEFMKKSKLIKEEYFANIKKFYSIASIGQLFVALSIVSIITLMLILISSL